MIRYDIDLFINSLNNEIECQVHCPLGFEAMMHEHTILSATIAVRRESILISLGIKLQVLLTLL